MMVVLPPPAGAKFRVGMYFEDLFAYLSTCTKKVRLCIMDYAGLSNDPNDVERFLK